MTEEEEELALFGARIMKDESQQTSAANAAATSDTATNASSATGASADMTIDGIDDAAGSKTHARHYLALSRHSGSLEVYALPSFQLVFAASVSDAALSLFVGIFFVFVFV